MVLQTIVMNRANARISVDRFRCDPRLGINGRSLSQASMGMAAGDPDHDGDIDFFLTHFSDDHNTYYEQVGPGHLGRPHVPSRVCRSRR